VELNDRYLNKNNQRNADNKEILAALHNCLYVLWAIYCFKIENKLDLSKAEEIVLQEGVIVLEKAGEKWEFN